jgi:hypothetical protein
MNAGKLLIFAFIHVEKQLLERILDKLFALRGGAYPISVILNRVKDLDFAAFRLTANQGVKKMDTKVQYPEIQVEAPKESGKYRLVLGESLKPVKVPRKLERMDQVRPARPLLAAQDVLEALAATDGSQQIISQIPNLADPLIWLPVATFSVCMKTGTATFLDIWDCDHFDGFTDIKNNLNQCRIWFSANGYTYWDSPQTKTGRINCFFRAPTAGNYVCNVQLQSYAGPAQVECLIDSFSYGPLPFNGTINQPHPAHLSAGYHSFRIRQMSGSFFFAHLSVWKV